MQPRHEDRQAVLCAVILAAYGNVLDTLVWSTPGLPGALMGTVGPLALLAMVLYWHCHLDQRALGGLGSMPEAGA